MVTKSLTTKVAQFLFFFVGQFLLSNNNIAYGWGNVTNLVTVPSVRPALQFTFSIVEFLFLPRAEHIFLKWF